MNTSNNLNFKSQNDNTEFEIDSYNEEEEHNLFMNKKELVHIEDDTSINVDKSYDDDHSKSSTIKKGFIINNISAINEQFPQNNNPINNKKFDNSLHDITGSDNLNITDNDVGSFPLMMSGNELTLRNSNTEINNNPNEEILQHIETKISQNEFGYMNNLPTSPQKNFITTNKYKRRNIEIDEIDDEDEEESSVPDIPNMLQNKFTQQNNTNNNQINIVKKNKNLYNNNSNNSNNFNNNSHNSNHNNNYMITSFSHYYIGVNKYVGSVNSSEATFGMAQSRDFQNKYNQLEANYNLLIKQNKKLQNDYEELKNSNKSVLELLTYWQKFYLEILEIVMPEKSKHNQDNSISDYMDDPYRIQIINQVKQLVLMARDKVYHNFYQITPIKFDIISNVEKNFDKNLTQISNKNINNIIDWNNKLFYTKNDSFTLKTYQNKKNKKFPLIYTKNDSFTIKISKNIKSKKIPLFYIKNNSFTFNSSENIKNKKISLYYTKNDSFTLKTSKNKKIKKFLDEDDDLDFLPPIKHIEKINSGMNTEITAENLVGNPVVKEVIKEIEIIKQIRLKRYDSKKLYFSKKAQGITFLNILGKKREIKNEKSNIIKNNKFNILKISHSEKLYIKMQPPKTPQKFKKNVMHKIAIVQTDMTSKNISSIETLNKACSSQLLNSQRDKEKMQKLYEEKISSLNDIISENDKLIKQLQQQIKNNTNKTNSNTINSNTNSNTNSNNNFSEPAFLFLPEMIPPENTYKIFMHCVKHFKYEEDIYTKYLEEDDLLILKAFVNKMEKYLIGSSLPMLKERKLDTENNIIINSNNKRNIVNKNENYSQKKFKSNILNGIKPIYLNIRTKNRTISDNKYSDERCNSVYNNSNTFNKYKAAIMTLKNS